MRGISWQKHNPVTLFLLFSTTSHCQRPAITIVNGHLSVETLLDRETIIPVAAPSLQRRPQSMH